MNKLKQSTIKKYTVKQLCKHLDSYQAYHVFPVRYRFNFNNNFIHKKDYNYQSHYVYYCNIKEYNRELIIDALNDIYAHSNH